MDLPTNEPYRKVAINSFRVGLRRWPTLRGVTRASSFLRRSNHFLFADPKSGCQLSRQLLGIIGSGDADAK